MRTKNKSTVALAAVNKAWESFYDTTKVESEKAIRAISTESKMTVAAISCRVETAIKKGMLESKRATIQTNQGAREVNLYRPISK